MRNFWTVMKLELFLTSRNWATWLIALAMILIGALAADNNRNQPWGSWEQFIFIGLFLTLILTFSTGNQVNRDRERKLDGVVFSTPVATPVYVLAKYCSALLSLFCLAGLSLLVAVLTDQFYNVPQRVLFLSPVIYPSLGSQAYLSGWAWTILVPVIFGATFMLTVITLTHGKRVVAYSATLLIWLIPLFTANSPDNQSGFIGDITVTSFIPPMNPATDLWFRHLMHPTNLPEAQFVQQIMHLSLAAIPPASLVNNLLWNRLLFLALSLVLLTLTIYGVQHARRHA